MFTPQKSMYLLPRKSKFPTESNPDTLETYRKKNFSILIPWRLTEKKKKRINICVYSPGLNFPIFKYQGN